MACTLRFENAGACTYPKGWTDYRAVASYDRAHWFRVPTRYDGTVMTVEHTPERDAVWYAYFEPYSLERHQALIGRAGDSPLARTERLGASVEGRDMDLVTIGRRQRREEDDLDHRPPASRGDDGRMVRRRHDRAPASTAPIRFRGGSSSARCSTSFRT